MSHMLDLCPTCSLCPCQCVETGFESLTEFYAADPRRRNSGEIDYGVWWYADTVRKYPWRVSWVRDTGELYAVRLTPPTVTSEPGLTAAIGGDAIGPVVLLAVIEQLDDLERRLLGWAEMCGRGESLQWARLAAQAPLPLDTKIGVPEFK